MKAKLLNHKRLIITLAALVAVAGIAGASNTPKPTTTNLTSTKVSQSQPKVETKTITTTISVPFTSTTVQDNTIAQGTTKVTTTGINGVKTQTWSVTYSNGTETSRKLVSEVVTTTPVDEVITQGTMVPTPAPTPAPTNCPNGTYTNTAGNVVCSPYNAPTAPAGATAQCVDGTYSFSQSRSGTCSHHGGVARWL